MSKRAYVMAHPKEFRDQVVELAQLGYRNAQEIAKEFGISQESGRRWLQQAECDQGSRQDGLSSPEREELARPRRENRRLPMEREILSKADSTASMPVAPNSRARNGARPDSLEAVC